MTLFWALPRRNGIPGCDGVVLPVRYRGEISRSGHTGASQCAQPEMGGRVGVKGDHQLKRGFLQSKNTLHCFPGYCYLRPWEKRQYNAHPLTSPGQVFETKSGHTLPQGEAGFAEVSGCFLDSVTIH
jgi:hypothetical protein